VDEHVHGRLGEARTDGAHGSQILNVERLERYAPVARLLADALPRLLAALAAAAQQHDVGAQVGERKRSLEADAGVRPGNEAAAAGEIDVQVLGSEAQRMDAKAGSIEGRDDERIDEAAERVAEPELRARRGAPRRAAGP
jgi:hypothetical protein